MPNINQEDYDSEFLDTLLALYVNCFKLGADRLELNALSIDAAKVHCLQGMILDYFKLIFEYIENN